MTKSQIKARLEYLRGEIEAQRISYGEIVELQSLAQHIAPNDVQLLEWAGVPENKDIIRCPECKGEVWDKACGSKLHKCHNCNTAFDKPYNPF